MALMPCSGVSSTSFDAEKGQVLEYVQQNGGVLIRTRRHTPEHPIAGLKVLPAPTCSRRDTTFAQPPLPLAWFFAVREAGVVLPSGIFW